jgi:hypothetical protein
MCKANELGDKITPRQSETAGIAMWIFEAEEVGDDDTSNDNTGVGVFGSAESIRAMKEAYDLFMNDPGFKSMCLLDFYCVMSFGPGADEAMVESDANTITLRRRNLSVSNH